METRLEPQRCSACERGAYREAVAPRYGPMLRLTARLAGVIAFAGVVWGLVIATSGFLGHYGAYPDGLLVRRSLLVGCALMGGAIVVGLGCLHLLEPRRVIRCDRCGHRPNEYKNADPSKESAFLW